MPQSLKPTEIRAFLETHGLTQKQFAEILPIPIRTLEDWLSETAKGNPPAFLTRALRDLARELKGEK